MRAACLLLLICTFGVQSQIRAQSRSYELQAGIGYARMFDAGGISFSAALDRSLSPSAASLQHGIGGAFWYAHTGIASRPSHPDGRDVLGVGARYRLTLGRAGGLRPFFAVPVGVLLSNIPDRASLQSPSLLVQGVPEPDPGPPTPVEDLTGGELGWVTGVELGLRISGAKRVSGYTSVQALYQNIYGSESRNGAWNWHAGLSYGF